MQQGICFSASVPMSHFLWHTKKCVYMITLFLCAAGRADIAAGQKVLEEKLNILLAKQQQALDAVNKATATLAALKDMAQKQAEALTALDAAVQTKLNAISVATQQGIISMAQVGISVQKAAHRLQKLAAFVLCALSQLKWLFSRRS